MIVILIAILCTFLFYYLACLSYGSSKQKIFFIASFIVSAFTLRLLLNPNLNNDYLLYYSFKIFHKPHGFFSYLLNEPYLYSVYSIFNIFIGSQETVFLAMYWFNCLITTSFFVWLAGRLDVQIWKKMLLFVLHFFLFGFVLLRNGPAYILFALFFYYSFRNKPFKWVILTPFIHVSSCLLLTTFFYKSKNYFKFLVLGILAVLLFFFLFKSFLIDVPAFDSILNKINSYSKNNIGYGFMHICFFTFVLSIILIGFLFQKDNMKHPILITTIFFYISTFFINPVVGHRFSPYLIFALLLYPFDTIISEKKIRIVNQLSVFLFPIFVYALFQTHRTEMFREILSNSLFN